MRTLVQRLNLLAGFHPASRAAILSEAIDHARPDELPALARAGAATNAPASIAAMIRRLHDLEDGGVPLLGRIRTKALRGAIDLVLRDESPRSARNAIAVIAARPDPVDLLPRLLMDPREGVAPAAASAFREIAVTLYGSTGRRCPPDALADGFDRALAAAARAYRAHRSESLLVTLALLSERPRASLRAVLDDEDEPVTRAVRSMVDRSDDPLVHANLVRWLGNPRLARPATRALSRLAGERAWADALRDGHLLRAPRRRGALLRLDRPARCAPSIGTAVALPGALQSHVPALLERIDLPSRVRRNRLADLVALPSPAARQAAVTALIAGGVAAAECLVPFALDRDARVARLAMHGLLLGGGEPDAGLLDRLASTGHRALALRAAARRARGGTEGFFRSWRLLTTEHRRAAALAVRERDRAGLVTGLRAVIGQGDERDRLDAIDLARRLGLVADLESELIEVVETSGPRVASAAIAALPEGRTPRRVSVLADALRHEHPRVVANAVESLARAGASRTVEVVASLVRSAANRPRANAIRALLDADPDRGRPALRAMLADPNPLHRVSAIWVARHGSPDDALETLGEMARADRVAEVRVRAEAARRWLAAGARSNRLPVGRRPAVVSRAFRTREMALS